MTLGYTGTHAPSLCAWEKRGCELAAATEPYLAAHHVLLAHGRAVRAYRARFQSQQGGKIGMTNNMDFSEPASRSADDVAAAARANEFWLGWFADPIYFGNYPLSMRQALGARLPSFSADESAMLKGSADVFGINTYAGRFVSARGAHGHEPPSVLTDGGFVSSIDPRWPRSNSTWLRSVPWAFRKLLNYIQARYDPAEIYVTENGWSVGAARPSDGVCDPTRVAFLRNYTAEMLRAIREDSVRVKGYIGWSMLDNFVRARAGASAALTVPVPFLALTFALPSPWADACSPLCAGVGAGLHRALRPRLHRLRLPRQDALPQDVRLLVRSDRGRKRAAAERAVRRAVRQGRSRRPAAGGGGRAAERGQRGADLRRCFSDRAARCRRG